jgi:hypothetical protein
MIPDPVDIIHCEVCELPHRRGVAVCEECRHLLGTAPNWERLRAEVSSEGLKALTALVATIVAAVSMLWLTGAVWIWPLVGMLAWSVFYARRWLAISKRLTKQAGPAQRG